MIEKGARDVLLEKNRMKHRLMTGAVLVAVLAGCSITQEVKPVADLAGKEICVVENPGVRAGFIDAYRRSLASRGFTVRMLPAGSDVAACPITSTYNARWSWDLALYMSFAELRVYGNGKPAGEATYDSTRGGGNMNKFIEADKKIDELVTLLFPPRKGT